MRALVTGANGFIGSFLVEKLLQEGRQVRCLVRKTSNLRWIENLDIELWYGDMFDHNSLTEAVQGVDEVFHLAGVTKGKTEEDYIHGNYKATQNLLSVCEKYGSSTQKFIFVSSQAAGGPSPRCVKLSEDEAQNPISSYGHSKHRAEAAVLEYSKKRPATIIRPPSVYGPRDDAFLELHKIVNYGIIPKPGRGDQQISIIHVADLIEGIYRAAMARAANGEIFFISNDGPVTFYQLGKIVATVVNKKAFTLPIPLVCVDIASTATSLLAQLTGKPALINPDKVLEMKQPAWICSNAKAKTLLNFEPQIDIVEGMRKTAEWYRQKGWL